MKRYMVQFWFAGKIVNSKDLESVQAADDAADKWFAKNKPYDQANPNADRYGTRTIMLNDTLHANV